jgi:hypothetical protein
VNYKLALFACAFGFIGGGFGFVAANWIASQRSLKHPTKDTVQAHAYELLDPKGRIVGRWGSEGKNGVGLTFFDPSGSRTVELSESNSQQSLVFYQFDGSWIRMSLVAGSDGGSALHLGDYNRQARITLGAIDDNDLPTMEPPSVWGLAVRAPASFQNYLSVGVQGKFRSGSEKASILILRPDGTYWHAP